MHLPTETGNNSATAGITSKLWLADPALGRADEHKHITSILFTGDGCFISVFNNQQKIFHSLMQFDFGLKPGEAFTSNGYKSYKDAFVKIVDSPEAGAWLKGNVRLAYSSNRNTLVPGAFFNTETAEKCFSMNFRGIAGEILKHDYLRTEDAFVVYGIPPVVCDIVSEYFPTATLRSNNSLLINSLRTSIQAFAGKVMFLDISASNLKIIGYDNGSLIYTNDFEVHAPEDIAYYAVFVAGQLGNKNDITTWFSGDIKQGSRLFNLLVSYLGTASFITIPQDIQLAPVMKEIAWHEYFRVFNISLCES